MNKTYLTKGGECIQYDSYFRLIVHSKTKERALKIKKIIDARNKR